MARLIPEDIILDIQQATDIYEIVSETVQLKKSGQGFMGLCPFHSEKTPSFHVNPVRGIYHCFGCGVGGDVLSFVMKRDGLTFPEAVRMLAARCGITLPEPEKNPAERRVESQRESLYAVNRLSMEYFKGILFKGPQGEPARRYLANRGMTETIAETFQLGYAPDGWDNLVRFLSGRNIPRQVAETSGLIATKNKERYYDRFRNRIIFPILDQSRRVIGFGGRVLDDSLPKYLNSPETPVYSKSRSLYGFHATRQACRQTGAVHIVEGYFDLLSLYMYGVEHVVATLGTAITQEHIRMLSRAGVRRFVMVYDSDEAGIRAAERSIPVFQKEFISANILVLPKGHDPDSYIREFGPEAFMKLSDQALGVIPFLLESAVRQHGLSVEGRIRIIEVMTEPIRAVEDPIGRSLYVRELADRIGVDEKAVLEKIREQAGGPLRRVSGPAATGFESRPVERRVRYLEMEKQILSMMLQFPEILDDCRRSGVVDYLEHPALKALARKILDHGGDPSTLAPTLIARSENDAQRKMISALAVGDIPWLYKNCVNLIDQFVRNRKKHEDSLSEQIRIAELNQDHDLLMALMKEKMKRLNQ
ncbi:DNA primase [Desulfatiferula olefinivorans]